MSARPSALGDSELMAHHQDLRVLPPRLPPRQAQHQRRTGHDQEDQPQAHKPKIIPPDGVTMTAGTYLPTEVCDQGIADKLGIPAT